MYEAELVAAMQPDENGWPAEGPFTRFLEAEQVLSPSYVTGGTPPTGMGEVRPGRPLIRHDGLPALPGILLDEGVEIEVSHLSAPLVDPDNDPETRDAARAERYQELVFARQRVSTARLADEADDYRPAAIMPSSVLDEVCAVAPHRVEHQATTLLLAMSNGWRLRFVPRAVMSEVLPTGVITSVVLSSHDGPEAAYQESAAGAMFTKKRPGIRAAVGIQETLAERAMATGDAIRMLYDYGGNIAESRLGPMASFMARQSILINLAE